MLSLRHQFEAQYQNEAMQLNALRDGCGANELRSISRLLSMTHLRLELPGPLQHSFQAEVDPVVRIVLCTIEIPDFRLLNIVKERGSKWVTISVSVDGPNLIAMLRKHGRRYRVDLAEARRLAASDDSEDTDLMASLRSLSHPPALGERGHRRLARGLKRNASTPHRGG